MSSGITMDTIQLQEDVNNFCKTVANKLERKGIRIDAQLHNRPAYGHRVVISWWLKTPNNSEDGEELLHQSLFRIKEGCTWNHTFFLRKLLNEQAFLSSCENIIPGEEEQSGGSAENVVIRNCSTCSDNVDPPGESY